MRHALAHGIRHAFRHAVGGRRSDIAPDEGLLVSADEPLIVGLPAGAEVIDLHVRGGNAALQIDEDLAGLDPAVAKQQRGLESVWKVERVGIPELAFGGELALEAEQSLVETRAKVKAVASSSWRGYGGTRKMLRFLSRNTNGTHALEIGKAYPVGSSITMFARFRISANMAGETGAICGLFPKAATDQVPSLRLSHFPTNRITVIGTSNNGQNVSTAQDNVPVIYGAEYAVWATFDAATGRVGLIRFTPQLGVYAITSQSSLPAGLDVEALPFFFIGGHNADGHFIEADYAELALYLGVIPPFQALAAAGPNAFPGPEYLDDAKDVRAWIPLLEVDPLRDWQTNRRLAPINGGSGANVQILDSDFAPQMQPNCLLPMVAANVINQAGDDQTSPPFAASANCKTGMHIARVDHAWNLDVAASSPDPTLARATELAGGDPQLVGIGADLVAAIRNQSGDPADASTLNLCALGTKKLAGVMQAHPRNVDLGDIAGGVTDGEWSQYGDIETVEGWRDPVNGKLWFVFLSGTAAWIGYVDPLTGLWVDPVAGGFQVNAGQWADITRAIKATMCGSANGEMFLGGILGSDPEKNQCGFATLVRDGSGNITGVVQQQCGDVATYSTNPQTLGMFNPLVIQNPAAPRRVMVGSMQGGLVAYIDDVEQTFRDIPNTPSTHPDVCFRFCRNSNHISTMSCAGPTSGRIQWTHVFAHTTQIVQTDVTGYRGQGGQEADFDATGYHSPAYGMQLCFVSQVLNRTGVRKYVPNSPTDPFGEALCEDGYSTLRTITIDDMVAQGALYPAPAGKSWYVQSIEPGPADWHFFTTKLVNQGQFTTPVMAADDARILGVNFETGVVRRFDRGLLDGQKMIRHEAEPVLLGPYPGNRARIGLFINEKRVDNDAQTITRTDVFVDTGIVVEAA